MDKMFYKQKINVSIILLCVVLITSLTFHNYSHISNDISNSVMNSFEKVQIIENNVKNISCFFCMLKSNENNIYVCKSDTIKKVHYNYIRTLIQTLTNMILYSLIMLSIICIIHICSATHTSFMIMTYIHSKDGRKKLVEG